MAVLLALLLASEILPFVTRTPGNGLVHTIARYAVEHCQRELDHERHLGHPDDTTSLLGDCDECAPEGDLLSVTALPPATTPAQTPTKPTTERQPCCQTRTVGTDTRDLPPTPTPYASARASRAATSNNEDPWHIIARA